MRRAIASLPPPTQHACHLTRLLRGSAGLLEASMERVRILIALIALFFSVTFATAQQTNAVGAVPNLINYSGVLKDDSGKVLTSITGVTFLIYSEQQGGAPVWMETQNV